MVFIIENSNRHNDQITTIAAAKNKKLNFAAERSFFLK